MKKTVLAVVLMIASLPMSHAQATSMNVNVSASAAPSFGAMSNLTIGKYLRVPGMWVPVYTSSPVTVTVTSSDASKATVSASATVAGTVSATFTSVTTGFMVYVDGIDSTGSATLTASAAGFTNATSTVTLAPSGFVFCFNPNGSAFVGQVDTTLQICAASLTTSLKMWAMQPLQPGAGPVNVTVTSSSPASGTVTSPVTFYAGDVAKPSTFHAVAGGTTSVTLSTPSGFSTPTQ